MKHIRIFIHICQDFIHKSCWQHCLLMIKANACSSLCSCSHYREGKKTLLLGRDVVKLITPGTLIEPLDNEANYLLCISTGPGSTVGLVWIDISTGEFQVWMSFVSHFCSVYACRLTSNSVYVCVSLSIVAFCCPLEPIYHIHKMQLLAACGGGGVKEGISPPFPPKLSLGFGVLAQEQWRSYIRAYTG